MRQAAPYVERVLNSTKPGELPIQLPAKFALVVSVKSARAIGLTIPRALLARADRVID